jgi:hypothetical protein
VRYFYLWIGLLCLSGCGNANDGQPFTPYNKRSAIKIPNPVQVAASTKPLFCRDPLLVSSLSSFNQAYSGSSLCVSEGSVPNSRGYAVHLKMRSDFPQNVRLCLIPFQGDFAATESCFLVNGQADVTLTVDDYTSAVLLPEGNLLEYKAYLNNPAISPPPRVIFSLQ